MRQTPLTPLRDIRALTPDERVAVEALSRFPDPTADRAAIDRVWRRLTPVAQPRAARGGRWLLVAGVAVVVALIAPLHSWLGGSPAELVLASGSVSGPRLPEIAEHDHLLTEASSEALIRLGDVASLLVAEDTDVSFDRLTHGTVLHLARGMITARVSKRPPDEPFSIETDHCRVTVVGTLFSVALAPGGQVAVSVREGVVEVSRREGGLLARVVAGARWTSDGVDAGVDRTSDAVATLLEESQSGGAANQLRPRFEELRRLVRPTLPAEPDRSRNERAPADRPAVRAPKPPKAVEEPPAPAQPPGVAAPHETVVVPVEQRAPDRAETSVVNPPLMVIPLPASIEEKPPPPQPVPKPVAEAPRSPGETPYLHAQALREQGDYAGAAKELQQAIVSEPRFAEHALFELGEVQQQKLNQPNEALATFKQYRLRYPNGRFVPETDFAILELQVDRGHDAEAQAEAARFLTAHPDLPDRADQVRLVRAKLLSDRGDFARALQDYRDVSRPGALDDATFLMAYCQERLGDRAGAEATLRAYLARFPKGRHRKEATRALGSP